MSLNTTPGGVLSNNYDWTQPFDFDKYMAAVASAGQSNSIFGDAGAPTASGGFNGFQPLTGNDTTGIGEGIWGNLGNTQTQTTPPPAQAVGGWTQNSGLLDQYNTDGQQTGQGWGMPAIGALSTIMGGIFDYKNSNRADEMLDLNRQNMQKQWDNVDYARKRMEGVGDSFITNRPTGQV